MRLLPGHLNTTAHESVIADGELAYAFRCSRDRAIFEIDRAYRQVEPLKADGGQAFAFGAYPDVERFIIVSGDKYFVTSTDTSEEFLERTTDGDTTLMVEYDVPTGTYITQYADNWYLISPTAITRVNIVLASDSDLLRQNYDSSLHGFPITAINPDFTTVSWAGTGSVAGGTPGTVTLKSGGVIRFLDTFTSADEDYEQFILSWDFGTLQDGIAGGYAYLTMTTDEDGAYLAGYSRSNTEENGFNEYNMDGVTCNLVFKNSGTAETWGGLGRFIISGKSLYLVVPTPDDMGQFDQVDIQISMSTNAAQKLSIGNIVFTKAGLDGTLEDDLKENGWLGGLGPVYDTDEYMTYAIRGTDATVVNVADARLVQFPKSKLWARAYFSSFTADEIRDPSTQFFPFNPNSQPQFLRGFFPTGTTDEEIESAVDAAETAIKEGTSTGIPQWVQFDLTGYNDGTGFSHIQLLRKASDDNWYQIGFGLNSGTEIFVDQYTDAELIALGTPFTLDPEPMNPSPSDITAGTEWKGHLVFGDKLGRVYFSKQGDPTIFIWRDYVDGTFSTDIRPRFVDVASQNDPILAMFGMDSLFVLTRRRVFWMSGPNAASALGPFEFQQGRGCLGSKAACAAGQALLMGSDDGLYALSVQSNNLGQPGNVSGVNLTRDKLRDSWAWLIETTRENVSVCFAADHIWVFNGVRFLHRNPSGFWCVGEWADGAIVTDSATDGKGRIAVLFDSGRVGYIGDFTTDGGVTLAGTDGLPIYWEVLGRKEMLKGLTSGIIIQQVDDELENPELVITAYGDKRTDGVELEYDEWKNLFSVPKDGGGIGNRWNQLRVRGGVNDRLAPIATTSAPTPIK